jgi:hypothetical protein
MNNLHPISLTPARMRVENSMKTGMLFEKLSNETR